MLVVEDRSLVFLVCVKLCIGVGCDKLLFHERYEI
jgi:hypothetical protein